MNAPEAISVVLTVNGADVVLVPYGQEQARIGVSPQQIQLLQMLCRELGFSRPERLGMAETILETEVVSFSALSMRQAGRMIDVFRGISVYRTMQSETVLAGNSI